MKKNFGFVKSTNKIKIAAATRMLQLFGEGESGIKNQGRLDHSQSFSQETGAIGQQTPRIGEERPKLKRELSARMRVGSDSTPHLFFLPHLLFLPSLEGRKSNKSLRSHGDL